MSLRRAARGLGGFVRFAIDFIRLSSDGHVTTGDLDFQISDGPHPLLSDGVPYVFEWFEHEGRRRENEVPLNSWVVRFP